MYTKSDDNFLESGKLTKALPNALISLNRKNLFINQWLSKMQGKFEINYDYYSTDWSQLIYAEYKVGGKALQYLEPCLHINLITFFAIIANLFNYLKDILDNFQ